MLSLNVRTPVHENNHTSHRVQDPSLIRISQQVFSLYSCFQFFNFQFKKKDRIGDGDLSILRPQNKSSTFALKKTPDEGGCKPEKYTKNEKLNQFSFFCGLFVQNSPESAIVVHPPPPVQDYRFEVLLLFCGRNTPLVRRQYLLFTVPLKSEKSWSSLNFLPQEHKFWV